MIDSDEVGEMIRRLAADGYRVTPPAPPDPPKACAYCGKTEEEQKDEDDWPLTPIEIYVNAGNEGASHVVRWYCDSCIGGHVGATLVHIGLGSHHHGSTTAIEYPPERCGGYRECPWWQGDSDDEVYYSDPQKGDTE